MLGGHGLACYALKLFVGADYQGVGFGRVRVIIPWHHILLSQGCWHQDQHGYKSRRSQVEYSLHDYSVASLLCVFPNVLYITAASYTVTKLWTHRKPY